MELYFSDDEEKKDLLHRRSAFGHFRHCSPHDLALNLKLGICLLFLVYALPFISSTQFSPVSQFAKSVISDSVSF